jgi:hypothetical protein
MIDKYEGKSRSRCEFDIHEAIESYAEEWNAIAVGELGSFRLQPRIVHGEIEISIASPRGTSGLVGHQRLDWRYGIRNAPPFFA